MAMTAWEIQNLEQAARGVEREEMREAAAMRKAEMDAELRRRTAVYKDTPGANVKTELAKRVRRKAGKMLVGTS